MLELKVLEDSLVEKIIDEALLLLQETGVEVQCGALMDRMESAGLNIDKNTNRITFPKQIVKDSIRSLPSLIDLYDRGGELFSTIGGDSTHFVPGSSALNILDWKTGERRTAQTPDFVEYIKVADQLKHISYPASAFSTEDIPQDVADAWRLYLMLAHSDKPVVTGAFTHHGVNRMAEMMACFRKDKNDLIEKPMAVFTCCPNSPLRWGLDSSQNLIDCVENGIIVEIVPVLMIGLAVPVTTVGALVMQTAEVLSGIVFTQLIKPGAPVIFGGAPGAFHMQLMSAPMSGVEALQLYSGYAQIARHLGIPSQGYMGLGDGKFNDPQAGSETASGAYIAAMSRMNQVAGPGMLDFVNCFSLEKLVFDDEICGHVNHFMRDIKIKDDLPIKPFIDEVLVEQQICTMDHTLEYWPKELYLPGPMVDRTSWDQWEQFGSKKLQDRARETIKTLLDQYNEVPLDDILDTELRAIMIRGIDNSESLPSLK
ncbi:MAG: trimethylamine methyltransferase family protein [Candidatus Marinimicrobia bacterium]|nr:trimethylamine methyltransferase family protein [Candidatus Neomarinimicrobiota bacterium]